MDLLFCVGALMLIISLVVPVLAATDAETQREQCRNNLRLIGKAFQAWAKDHGNRLAWRVPRAEGGTAGLPSNSSAWLHYAWLSNHLESPKYLTCPADKGQAAKDWGRMPDSGFLHSNFRANALSYFVGIDAHPEAPHALLAGDHNLNVSGTLQKCDFANVNIAVSLKPGDGNVGWTQQALHGNPGNVLTMDGQVQTLSSEDLRGTLPKTGASHEDNHLLMPR